jgi:hypothetical protein
MSDAVSTWWFSADRKWHKGQPPPGWWQSPDGHWHPPTARPTTPTAAAPRAPEPAATTATTYAPDTDPADTHHGLHLRPTRRRL